MSDSENFPERTVVYTTDRRRSYTLETLQTLYIFTSDPAEKFAERYNLPISLVELHVQRGKWNELRAQHTEKAMAVFKKAVTTQVEDSLDIEIKLQSLRNIQAEQQVNELAKYFEKYGHLFGVDKEGNMLKDMFGFPIPLKIPYASKQSHELIQGLESRFKHLVEEQKLLEEQQKRDEPKNSKVLVADYKHLLKPAAKPNDPT